MLPRLRDMTCAFSSDHTQRPVPPNRAPTSETFWQFWTECRQFKARFFEIGIADSYQTARHIYRAFVKRSTITVWLDRGHRSLVKTTLADWAYCYDHPGRLYSVFDGIVVSSSHALQQVEPSNNCTGPRNGAMAENSPQDFANVLIDKLQKILIKQIPNNHSIIRQHSGGLSRMLKQLHTTTQVCGQTSAISLPLEFQNPQMILDHHSQMMWPDEDLFIVRAQTAAMTTPGKDKEGLLSKSHRQAHSDRCHYDNSTRDSAFESGSSGSSILGC